VEGKVLLACQDEGCLKNLYEMLDNRRLTIHSVPDDADLLLKLLDDHYDALIYDLDFSTLDSLKMVKILRKLRPKVSLVVISNDASKELGGRILQEGVVYFGIKPVYSETVINVLSGVLS
jgi:DNA-binding NtrC family response regulator